MNKLNTNSNAYIIIYSTILVIVVAFLLAFVSSSLKEKQDANVALDIKKQILYSLNIRGLSDTEAEAKYSEVVKEEHEADGQKVYICNVDGTEVTVVSMKGMGLWGGISGFVAVYDKDSQWTVYGAYFNHESETAGLGAEIKDSQAWQEKFIGKKIFADDGTVALSVVKNVTDPETQVDCVTGATLTSNGVNDMIKAGLQNLTQQCQNGAKPCCQGEQAAHCEGHHADCQGEQAAHCEGGKASCCQGEQAGQCEGHHAKCQGEQAAHCDGDKAVCCEGEAKSE